MASFDAIAARARACNELKDFVERTADRVTHNSTLYLSEAAAKGIEDAFRRANDGEIDALTKLNQFQADIAKAINCFITAEAIDRFTNSQ